MADLGINGARIRRSFLETRLSLGAIDVHHLKMAVEVRLPGERLVAMLALERLLAGVAAQMADQAVAATESLQAEAALERPFPSVYPLVFQHILLRVECRQADAALVRPLIPVNAFVANAVALILESALAEATHVLVGLDAQRRLQRRVHFRNWTTDSHDNSNLKNHLML